MLLNFSDRTRTGAFSMIWPLAKERGKSSHYKPQKYYIKAAIHVVVYLQMLLQLTEILVCKRLRFRLVSLDKVSKNIVLKQNGIFLILLKRSNSTLPISVCS